jgi:hypothetical protein
MPEEAFTLKRNPDAEYSENYNVFFEGRYVGAKLEPLPAFTRQFSEWSPRPD